MTNQHIQLQETPMMMVEAGKRVVVLMKDQWVLIGDVLGNGTEDSFPTSLLCSVRSVEENLSEEGKWKKKR